MNTPAHWTTQPNTSAIQQHQEGRMMTEELIERLSDEADLCRNDGADDIANLLDKAASALRTRPDPRDEVIAELVEAATVLRREAVLLLNNAEGCAANHYGNDIEMLGMPQWLVDSRVSIAAATAALTKHKGTNP